jgi:phosphoribosylformimino-5-aminoimidazole carboxamide ribotide isomerase
MRILPVLDLLGGRVVRGVAGRRQEYRPVVSCLTSSTRPLDVARALRERLGLDELYVADLDAIAGQEPAFATFATLQQEGFRLWVDAGVDGPERMRLLADAGISTLIAGLETLAGARALADILRIHGERVVFSLDLCAGRALTKPGAWEETDAWALASRAVALGVRHLLVLDLARVGVGTGTGTEELCARLVKAFPQVEVNAGGGVRGRDDLCRLRDCGVQAVLVASALHDGRLIRSDLTDQS